MTARDAFFAQRDCNWVHPLRSNFTDTPLSDPLNKSDSKSDFTITAMSRSKAPRTLVGKYDLFETKQKKVGRKTSRVELLMVEHG
jgi:hypothetical protein